MKTPDRAMRSLSDAGDVRRALDTRRVMHDRDEEAATRASQLYEELRLLTTAQLMERLEPGSYGSTRAMLIADIIEKEASQ